MHQVPPTDEATPFDDGALYDLFFERLDLGLDFYLGLACAALDVACGTGRIMLPCLKAGVDVEGFDLYNPIHTTLRNRWSCSPEVERLTRQVRSLESSPHGHGNCLYRNDHRQLPRR